MSGAHSHHDHGAHDHGHGEGHHDHGHGPGHSHGHGHHHHAPTDFGARFAFGALLNIAFVVGEAVYGVLGHSLALLADAGHNLGDVLGLLAAWAAASLAKKAPSARYTYGLGSTSMLAALFNAVLLLMITGGVAWEAIRRLFAPEATGGATVMAVAAVGIAVNGFTALMFFSGRKDDLNVRSAFQHMLADALVAAGVVAAGALILFSHLQWIDPAVSLMVSAIIVWGTWGTLREALDMVLHAVPPGIDPDKVRTFLAEQPGLATLHDLHIWPTSTTETALTAHLVMPTGHPGDARLAGLCHDLKHRFRIGHATFQVETGDSVPCSLEPENRV
ncbi:MAG: cation diffusion facilitator family transporter [Pseudomonadota bacterium]|nr:cation diffusion facilitator family transporter [Pseudomonadota bacterium]